MLRNFGMRLAVVAGLAAVVLGGGWIGTRAVRAQESVSATKWKLAGSIGKPIGALAVDESDGTARTLLAAVGDEIRKTTNGGESWTGLVEHPFVGLVASKGPWALLPSAVASASYISVSPSAANRHLVLATSAAWDEPVQFEPRASLWRSADGGRSFERVQVGSAESIGHVFAVTFDPADPTGLRVYGFVDRAAMLGMGRGQFVGSVWASNDGGETWSIDEGIPALGIPNFGGAAAQEVGGQSGIFVGMVSPGESGELSFQLAAKLRGYYDSVGAAGKLATSSDAAKPNGIAVADLHLVRALVADRGVTGTFYVASKEGVLVSADDGVTWRVAGEGMAGETVTALAIHEGTRTLFAGTETGKVWALALPAAGADTAGTGTGTQPAANNPRPTLTSISPTNTQVGSTALTLTLTGTNFLSSSTVNFGSTTLSPGSITATSMTATVPNSAYAQAGVVAVTVANPGPGGGNSGGKEFKVQDFKFGPITPQTQTVIAGATATYKVQLLGLEGYNTEVTMTCSNGTPPAATCYFDPTDVTPSGIENVTITTTTNNAMVGPGLGPRRFGPLGTGAVRIYLVAAGFLGTGIYFLMGWRRREGIVSWSRGGVVVALCLVGGFVVSAGGCGGYKNSSANTGQGTTPGTYTITLSAAGVNSTTHNANIVLVVNNPQ